MLTSRGESTPFVPHYVFTLYVLLRKMRAVIVGNSGSGKSTLAKRLAKSDKVSHLDLDSLAWSEAEPTRRRALSESFEAIDDFLRGVPSWVVEGCYSDLIEHIQDRATHFYFMNLPVNQCVLNCRNRPWEPTKYESKEKQDENLEMLIGWVQDYFTRDDEFSHRSHQRIYDAFDGEKIEITSNR